MNGVPVASVVVGSIGSNAYYIYGGATPEGLTLQAPKGLLWFAIQREFSLGVREFNLGGMAAEAAETASLDHGLFKFKSSFGAVKRICIGGRKLLRPSIVAMKTKIHRLATLDFYI